MEQNIAKYNYYEGLIRKYGIIYESSASHGDFAELRNLCRLDLEGVVICLGDTNFISTIEIFLSNQDSYSVSINRFDNVFLTAKKHTLEGYGNTYNVEIQEVFSLLEEHLDNIDNRFVFLFKLEGCLSDAMESLVPKNLVDERFKEMFKTNYSTMSNEERIRSDKEIEKLKRILLAKKLYPSFLAFIPYGMNISKYGFNSIDEIRLSLINSKAFTIKNKNIQNTLGIVMDIVLKEEKLYLTCK